MALSLSFLFSFPIVSYMDPPNSKPSALTITPIIIIYKRSFGRAYVDLVRVRRVTMGDGICSSRLLGLSGVLLGVDMPGGRGEEE